MMGRFSVVINVVEVVVVIIVIGVVRLIVVCLVIIAVVVVSVVLHSYVRKGHRRVLFTCLRRSCPSCCCCRSVTSMCRKNPSHISRWNDYTLMLLLLLVTLFLALL